VNDGCRIGLDRRAKWRSELSLEDRKNTALEDPGAEMLDRLAGLWARFGRIALGVLAALVVVAVGAVLYARSRAAAEEQAAGRLAEASILFWRGEYARSLEEAKKVYGQFGSTASGADAHRLAGDNAFWLGDHKTAATEYRAYLSQRGTGLLADAVRRSLAYTLESDGQFAEAAQLYEQLVGRFDRESSGEMLAAAARCLVAAGKPAEAAQRLERLVDEFGETSLAAGARVDLAGFKPGTVR
jgi:tetratricopeptide (TPR) repeat protein